MVEDCYFMQDQDENISDEQRTMKVYCMDHAPKGAWFWEGSKEGYGPFSYICNVCGKVIHDNEDNEAEEIETTD
jgi:hypothetical protein